MNPLLKRRKKQREDLSTPIPKVKIPQAEADSPLPKSKIEGSERVNKTDNLPPPRQKSHQASNTSLSSRAGSKRNFQLKAQASRIPKATTPRDPAGSAPSKSGVKRTQEEQYLPPSRDKSRSTSKKIVPLDSGMKTAYQGQKKEKGKTPPVGEGRPSRKPPKPERHGLFGADGRKNVGSPAKKAKSHKPKKQRMPIPQDLLANDDKIKTKTPRKSKSPLKSKIPRDQ
ncbi:MAG: hypothetical protein ACE5OZ_07645 [Candidatus Heimdallarchaeota archaeon]